MTRIESQRAEVDKPTDKLFSFLSDFNNFEKLMPEQVTNWKSTKDECSFTINGMATIGMKIQGSTPHEVINIVSNGKVPFDFKLDVLLTSISEAQSSGQLIFEAELNPMVKMMVEKPLTNFFNLLAARLNEIDID